MTTNLVSTTKLKVFLDDKGYAYLFLYQLQHVLNSFYLLNIEVYQFFKYQTYQNIQYVLLPHILPC
jgi:hypothetical protein